MGASATGAAGRATRAGQQAGPEAGGPPPGLFPDADVHVVTGKGGTGKSTVAAALALALARGGRQVLLCEVEGRQGIAQMFDVEPLPYAETPVARGLPDRSGRTGTVSALHIDAESALLEYLSMFYRLGRAGKALDRFGVVEFATTIAPGVRDVLLTGKVYEAARRTGRPSGSVVYDAVVLDAPPTGRIGQFLNVNSELSGLARMGPIKSQADKVMTLLRSNRTRIHLVTLLEEMPMQETADGIAELRAGHLAPGAVVVNRTRDQQLDPAELAAFLDDPAATARVDGMLSAAGVPRRGNATLADRLLGQGRDHLVRRRLEDEQRQVVAALDVPSVELPLLADGVDLAGLVELAEHLTAQGLA